MDDFLDFMSKYGVGIFNLFGNDFPPHVMQKIRVSVLQIWSELNLISPDELQYIYFAVVPPEEARKRDSIYNGICCIFKFFEKKLVDMLSGFDLGIRYVVGPDGYLKYFSDKHTSGYSKYHSGSQGGAEPHIAFVVYMFLAKDFNNKEQYWIDEAYRDTLAKGIFSPNDEVDIKVFFKNQKRGLCFLIIRSENYVRELKKTKKYGFVELRRLEKLLEVAIQEENYEYAAVLRDRIRELKKKMHE